MTVRRRVPWKLRALAGVSRVLNRLGVWRGLLFRSLTFLADPTRLAGLRFTSKVETITFSGDLGNWIDWNVFFLGEYEGDLIRTLQRVVPPNPRATCIDVGANSGVHTLAFAKMFETVVAFEPAPALMRRLREHLQVNGVTNAAAYELALGSHDGFADLQLAPPSNTGRNTLCSNRVAHPIDTVRVVLRTGDGILSEIGSAALGLIKIDTEGYEIEVLKGLRNTIRRDHPIIVTELSPDSQATNTVTRILGHVPGYTAYLAQTKRVLFLGQSRTWDLIRLEPDTPLPNREVTLLLAPDSINIRDRLPRKK